MWSYCGSLWIKRPGSDKSLDTLSGSRPTVLRTYVRTYYSPWAQKGHTPAKPTPVAYWNATSLCSCCERFTHLTFPGRGTSDASTVHCQWQSSALFASNSSVGITNLTNNYIMSTVRFELILAVQAVDFLSPSSPFCLSTPLPSFGMKLSKPLPRSGLRMGNSDAELVVAKDRIANSLSFCCCCCWWWWTVVLSALILLLLLNPLDENNRLLLLLLVAHYFFERRQKMRTTNHDDDTAA